MSAPSREEVIRIIRDAGFPPPLPVSRDQIVSSQIDLVQFAALVAAAEREKLAAAQLQIEEMRKALEAVQAVSNNSEGVAGWHCNGAIATWDKLLPEVDAALSTTFAPDALNEERARVLEAIGDRLSSPENTTWITKEAAATLCCQAAAAYRARGQS